MTNTFRNTDTTRFDFVREVNEGRVTEVSGREVTRRFSTGKPGTTWQNGSVSVEVKGRKPGKVGTVWVRPGESVTFS